jgi:FAD binding domain-containing protein
MPLLAFESAGMLYKGASQIMNQKTDVLIIGGGATGPSLACQIERYGIDFIIAEENEGVTPYSKAIGVQARTLESYEQIGLAQGAVEQGIVAGNGRLLAGTLCGLLTAYLIAKDCACTMNRVWF